MTGHAAKHRLDKLGVELRLCEDAGDVTRLREVAQLGNARRARIRGIAERDGPRRRHVETGLEILVGVVEDEKGHVGNVFKLLCYLGLKAGDLVAGGLGIGHVAICIVGVMLGQFLGNKS